MLNCVPRYIKYRLSFRYICDDVIATTMQFFTFNYKTISDILYTKEPPDFVGIVIFEIGHQISAKIIPTETLRERFKQT